MKWFDLVVLLAVGTGAQAADAPSPKAVVTACLNPGANGTLMQRGQATAVLILKAAGIRLDWRSDERACAHRIASALARRAFRRTVTTSDIDSLMPYFDSGQSAGFDAGIE